MSVQPRIRGVGTAVPPYGSSQDEIYAMVKEIWPAVEESGTRDDLPRGGRDRDLAYIFGATKVHRRHSVVDFAAFYRTPRSTGDRMAEYAASAPDLGRRALERAFAGLSASSTNDGAPGAAITDFIVVSCTGYVSPGLDVLLAHQLGMPPAVRRLSIGHMGCFGALVGLRQARAALAVDPAATVALLCVELCSLHFAPATSVEALAPLALFGDAAGALVLSNDVSNDRRGSGPTVVDTYCAAEFAAVDQMTWTVGDEGFVMTLSPRVPVMLRRIVAGAVENLLGPHGLTASDITHWLVHPGGPSILDAIQGRLDLSDAQMAASWHILHEYGNCSSSTVLLILDHLLHSGATQPGEWGVMMAFGPGLTLELCLLRF